MFSAILSYLFGPAGHQTYRGLVIGPAGQQTYRAIAILSYLFGATPYRLEMISAILLGLALHLMDSYSFGAIPYGLLFLVSVIVCDGGGGGGGATRDILRNTVGFGATTYGFIFGMLQVSGDGVDNFHELYC